MQAKEKIYKIIFEHDTPAGKAFDLVLIFFVLLSSLAVALETVRHIFVEHKDLFFRAEWFFTILFTLELSLRLYSAPNKWKYLASFYGVIDILAVLPTYLALFVSGAQAFIILRALRLLRIFRILKLNNYTNAGDILVRAITASRAKITVFVFFVATFVTIVGALMYYIEGRENGFTSIPTAVYWSIVTMTTVGYGDITPQTPLGQLLSAILMITGYGVIAVPTGIISTEMARLDRDAAGSASSECDNCRTGQTRSKFCPECGRRLAGGG